MGKWRRASGKSSMHERERERERERDGKQKRKKKNLFLIVCEDGVLGFK